MRSALTLALGVLPASALAAETAGEAHGPNWEILGVAILNLGVLVLILLRTARRPIRDFLIQRSRSVARAIEAAEGRLRAAEEEAARFRGRLAAVEEEAEGIIRAAGEQAEADRTRRVDRARDTANRIRRAAGDVADQEIRRASDELRAEVADLSATLAAALLRENLEREDDRRLVEEYAGRVGGEA